MTRSPSVVGPDSHHDAESRNRLATLLASRAAATGRRLGWGVADQGIGSLSNFFLGAFVAKTLGAASLGVLALTLIVFTVVLNASRGVSTDPLVVRFSGVPLPSWREASAAASGLATMVGVAAGIVSLAVGCAAYIGTGSELGLALMALAVGLPGLMLQDSWRFAFFAQGRGSRAFVNDLVWTVLLIGGLLVLHPLVGLSLPGVVLLFGGTATLAGLMGILQSRVLPSARPLVAWWDAHRDLGARYLAENVILSLSGQFRTAVTAAASGHAATGQLRVAEMLFGPFLVVLRGLAQVAVPEGQGFLRRGIRSFRGFCLGVSLGAGSLALVYGVVLYLVLPHGIGDLAFGPVWESAYPLVPGAILISVSASFVIGASAGLRTLGQARLSLRAQIIQLALAVAGSAVGAVVWGVQGTVWGSAAAGCLAAGVWWLFLRAGLQRYQAGAAGDVGPAVTDPLVPGTGTSEPGPAAQRPLAPAARE